MEEIQSWTFEAYSLKLMANVFEPKESVTWLAFYLKKDTGEDAEFQFGISIWEGAKNPDLDLNGYIEKAIENIKHYIKMVGIRGKNQVHIFDFTDSDFIPRENIDWP